MPRNGNGKPPKPPATRKPPRKRLRSVYLPETFWAELEAVAIAKGLSVNGVMALAVRYYLDNIA